MSKINLQIPEVAIREIRLGSITGFQGGAEELVNYSRCGLKDKSRSFSQCLGCSTSQAYLFRIFLYQPHFFCFPGTAIVFFFIIC